MKPVLILVICIILLAVMFPIVVQRVVEQERQNILEEVRKDSSRMNHYLVCSGFFGDEAAKLAQSNDRCK